MKYIPPIAVLILSVVNIIRCHTIDEDVLRQTVFGLNLTLILFCITIIIYLRVCKTYKKQLEHK